jgi:ATP-dependent protease ClpP protease subunit
MKTIIWLLVIILLGQFVHAESNNKNDIIHLTTDNVVTLRGEINGITASNFINEIVEYKSGEELYIYIISGGGSVISGMEIVRTINDLTKNGVNVKCIANTAMSMAFVIFQTCPERYVTESSVLMQHQMSLGIKGPIRQVTTYLDFVTAIENELEEQQSRRIGIPENVFREKVAHDWWLFGNDIVKKGAADKMVHVICDFIPELKDEVVATFFGDVTLTFSTCPLARDPVKISFDNSKVNATQTQIKNHISSMFDINTMASKQSF